MKLKELLPTPKMNKINLSGGGIRFSGDTATIYLLCDEDECKDILPEDITDANVIAEYNSMSGQLTSSRYSDVSYAFEHEARLVQITSRKSPKRAGVYHNSQSRPHRIVFVQNLVPRYDVAVLNKDDVAIYTAPAVPEPEMVLRVADAIVKSLATPQDLTVAIRLSK